MKNDYLESELFGKSLREFCTKDNRSFFFQNLKKRVVRAKKSTELLFPKNLTVPEIAQMYAYMEESCDEIYNRIQYGMKFLHRWVTVGDIEAIQEWKDFMKRVQDVCSFLEKEERNLKERCRIYWGYGIECIVDEVKSSSWIVTATSLPQEPWGYAMTEPLVTVHAITKETLSSLEKNQGGFLYRITQDNLLAMSTSHMCCGTVETEEDRRFYTIPEIERLFLWPDCNKYFSINLHLDKEDVFQSPESFVQQATEKLGKKGSMDLGLGSILLKNDWKELYGIFYQEDSDEEFKEKVKSFSQVFGVSIFEAKKDGTMKLVNKVRNVF